MNAAMAESPQPQFKTGVGSIPGADTGPVSRRQAAKSVPLGGMTDRTLLSGWIRLRLAQLPTPRRQVLEAVLINPRRLCSCGRACCRGWSVKSDWVEAVRGLCDHLAHRAEVSKEAGKRGYSTDPRLRQALVEDYCRPEAKRASIADLVNTTDASSHTVAKHRELIHTYLLGLETEAWNEISEIFDLHGITGSIES